MMTQRTAPAFGKRIFNLAAIGWTLFAFVPTGCDRHERSLVVSPAASDLKSHNPETASPLPDAPVLSISPEDVPGADGSLAVVNARPVGAVIGSIRPTITFSKPIIALGTVDDGKKIAPPATIHPAIDGEWQWLGSATVEFIPKGAVPYSTDFTVTVPKGLTAVDGSQLKESYAWAFETPRPKVQSVDPTKSWRWLTPKSKLSIVFNQPVAHLSQHLKLKVGADQTEWPFEVSKEISVADEQHTANPSVRRPPHEELKKNRQTRYEITPKRDLPIDSTVRVELDAELKGKEGPLHSNETVTWNYKTYGPMRVTGIHACWPNSSSDCHFGPLIIGTTNPADVRTLPSRLTIDPKVEINWDQVESELAAIHTDRPFYYVSVTGSFRPGVTYTIKLSEGLSDEFGQIAESTEASIHFANLQPSFDVGSDVALIEKDGDGALPVETTNLTSLNVKVWGLTPSEMARLISRRNDLREAVGTPTSVTLDVAGAQNVMRTTPLRVRDLLSSKTSKLFFAKIQSKEISDKYRRSREVVGQITALAVHAKLGSTSGLAWVTRLSDGRPVDKAEISLFDRDGKVVWRGESNADGVAEISHLDQVLSRKPSDDRWQAPFALLAATKDADTGVTLSTWTGGFAPWSFELPSDFSGREAQSLGSVIADRGIYRPGDEVFLKGLVRYRKLGQIVTPAEKTNVKIKALSNDGKEIFAKTVQLTDFGTFSARFQLDKEVSLGSYEVTAVATIDGDELLYQGQFRVEEYRAPQFTVDVTSDSPHLFSGDALKGRVLARYLFGGALANADSKWSVVRSTIDFQPKNQNGFTFGVQTWWWDDERPEPSADTFSVGESKTDAMGAISVNAGQVETAGDRTWQYTLEAEVTDVNRQRMAGRASVLVHPAAVYAGIRTRSEGFAEVGKPFALEFVAATPEGNRREDIPLDISISRRDWKSVRKKGVGDRWFTVTEPTEEVAQTCQVKTLKTPVACTVTPKEPGLYIVKATLTDAQGRQQTSRSSFYAIGSGWVSWQRNDSDRIDLVSDKTSYDIGETAQILVKSPYPEAEALLTVEREGVLSSRRVKLTGAATALPIRIDESMIPNVFVSVVLVRGRVQSQEGLESGDDPGRPSVRIGYTQLKVEKKSKRLSVQLAVDSAEKRPRDKVRVDIQVNDAQGRGQHAEVALWAVDEGVLRLTDYQVPDPVELIHPLRGLAIRIGEPLIHLVQRKRYGEKGQNAGGSGGGDTAGSALRSKFKTTAVFAPEIVTDDRGHGIVEFDLSDQLTTYRIMALAISKGDLVGTGGAEIVVSKPLLAMPALPRVARVGDIFEAGVVIHSPGAKVSQATITSRTRDLALLGPSTQEVQLGGGKAVEVRFRYRAMKAGEATLQFDVAGGGERDAVEQKLAVLQPVELETVAISGDTTSQRVETVALPSDVQDNIGGLDINLASSVMGGFSENMRQLVDYPYGCLEQMSSRLVPFVALRELQGKFAVSIEAPDDLVQKTVLAIENLQMPSGGYKYWPSSECVSDWASAYAVLALGRAMDVGFRVDAKKLQSAQTYLANVVAAGLPERCGFGATRSSDVTRVFALYVLGRTHAPKASYYPELFARRQNLPLFAQAMLADAMFVAGGDRAQARQLLSELLNFAKESATEVRFEEINGAAYATAWSSDVRTTALVLQTLTDISPAHPYVAKIAQALSKSRLGNGRFRNTQEAAFALMALSEVVRTKEKESPAFTAKVILGKDLIGSASFEGRSLSPSNFAVPIAKFTSLPHNTSLQFQRDGTAGVLYYSASLRYAPKEIPKSAIDRGIVVQRWIEPYAGGGQVKSIAAGELVRIRVRIASHMQRHFVAVDVPLPSGLEAVDTTLATTARRSIPRESEPSETFDDGNEGFDDEDVDRSRFGASFWSPFDHSELRDDRVVFFADALPPGVHVATVVARATTPGEFILKSARAEEMYSPEVFGRSEGGAFNVVGDLKVGAR